MTISASFSRTIKKYLSAILVCFSIPTMIHAQSILEQSGGVKTDFIFIQDADTVEVTSQLLIQRGFSRSSSKYSIIDNSSYGYASAYGMQVYVLEFITTTSFQTLDQYDKKRLKYLVKMISEDGKVLFSRELYRDHFTSFTVFESDTKIVCLHLNNLPIVMLDQTKVITIDIVD